MLSTRMYKDPFEYRKKVVFGLSGRMIVGGVIGVACAVLMAVYLNYVLGVPSRNPLSQILIIASALPALFLAGFYKPAGLDPEVFLKVWYRKRFTPQRIYYKPTVAMCGLQETLRRREDVKIDPSWSRLRKLNGIERWNFQGKDFQ